VYRKIIQSIALISTCGSLTAGVVYEKNWEAGEAIGAEWKAEGKVIQSPNGKKTLLANIGDKPMSLTVENLPEHQVLVIEAELILKGTWDGSSPTYGPDIIEIKLGDGRVLMNTTFSNCAAGGWVGTQHYPMNVSHGREFRSFYGALANGSLGWKHNWGNKKSPLEQGIDAVYKLRFAVPHEAARETIIITPKLAGEKGDDTQWMGVGTIKVSTESESEISDEEWNKLVALLDGEDALKANDAFWKMLQYPTRAKQAIADNKVLTLPEYLALLADDSFEVRNNAMERIVDTHTKSDIAKITKIAKEHEHPEVRVRLRHVLGKLRIKKMSSSARGWWVPTASGLMIK